MVKNAIKGQNEGQRDRTAILLQEWQAVNYLVAACGNTICSSNTQLTQQTSRCGRSRSNSFLSRSGTVYLVQKVEPVVSYGASNAASIEG